MKFRKNKYNNKRLTIEGVTFDSKREYTRWCTLQLLERSGEIQDLQRQVKFDLIPTLKHNGETLRKITYSADFTYTEKGIKIIEDSKGFATDVFKLKLRMMLIKYHEYEFRVT